MTRIKLCCQGASAWAKVDGAITAGTVGIPIEIELDSAWDDLICTLVCMGGDNKIPLVLGAQTPVVAWESLIPGVHLYLGMEGRSREGDVVLLSSWADCGQVQPSTEHDAGEAFTPPEKEQLLLLAGAAKQDSQRALEICQALEQEKISTETIHQSVMSWLQEHPQAGTGYDDTVLSEKIRSLEESVPALSQAVENVLEGFDGKVDLRQSPGDAGKVLTVLSDGTVAPRSALGEEDLPENLVIAEQDDAADEDGTTVEALLLNRLTLESNGGYICLKFGTQTLGMVEVGSPTVYCTGVTIMDEDMCVDLASAEECYLAARVTPGSCTQPLRWSSSNVNVATVDGQGKLTLVGAGTTQIKAACGGYWDSITLEVTDQRITGWSILAGYAVNVSAAQWTIYSQNTRGYSYFGNADTPIPITGGKTYRIFWDDIAESGLDADGISMKISTFSGTARLSSSADWISERSTTIQAEAGADGLAFNIRVLSGATEKAVSAYTSWLEAHIYIKEVA